MGVNWCTALERPALIYITEMLTPNLQFAQMFLPIKLLFKIFTESEPRRHVNMIQTNLIKAFIQKILPCYRTRIHT